MRWPVIAILSVCTPWLGAAGGRDLSDASPRTRPHDMDPDLDSIATEVFREFLRQDRTPEDRVRVYYLGGNDGFRVDILQFATPRLVLKRGNGCKTTKDGDREADTGRPCAIIHIRILSIQQRTATAAVSWHEGPAGAGGISCELEKKDGAWMVESVTDVFAS